jgi:hypothetical protein
VVEGDTLTAPQQFIWVEGSTRDVGVISPQTDAADTTYWFSSWSDGGAINHSIEVSNTDTVYTANFSTGPWGPPGYLGVFGDTSATVCFLEWGAPGLLRVHVIHKAHLGATASEFRVGWSDGFSPVHLGESSPFLLLGRSDTGVSIGYNGCQTDDVLVLSINYYVMSPPPPCSYFQVKSDQAFRPGELLVLDCATEPNWYDAGGGRMYIDPDENCDCIVGPVFTTEVAVETSPPGFKVSADSVLSVEPRHFDWLPGSTHEIAVDTFQTAGTDSIGWFTHWSDGGAPSHLITTPDTIVTFTAYFVQYYNYPTIESTADVPDDQGGQLVMNWRRSGYDVSGSPKSILEYEVFRFSDPASLESVESSNHNIGHRNDMTAKAPAGDWEILLTIPATHTETYAAVVSTNKDSSQIGPYHSRYFVRAKTDSAGVYFDSPVDSGYSVDNIPPGIPQGFVVAYNSPGGTKLSWEPSSAPDISHYTVYRSEEPDFEPIGDNVVDFTVDTTWTDTISPAWMYFYKIRAFDINLNGSVPAPPPGAVTDVPEPPVFDRVVLEQNVPNPFNPTTTISFYLPTDDRVRLSVYNSAGMLVRTIVNGQVSRGMHEEPWSGRDNRGAFVSSGVYFYRLETSESVLTKKMVLLK